MTLAATSRVWLMHRTWGGVGIVVAVFFGLKAAVLAVVPQAVIRVGAKALRNWAMVGIAAAAFAATFS